MPIVDLAVLSREEIFGPVLPVLTYDRIETVIDAINAGDKPLALYIFVRDAAGADEIIRRTTSGAVGVNLTLVHYTHLNLPFGGVKNSGYGRELSEFGIREFVNIKTVWIGPSK